MAHSPGGFLDGDAWFHGSISRDEAEDVLNKDGEEGSFLVRESSSSVGDYAISVLSVGSVHHVQIKRHEGDAFFSLDDGPVIHGLDELIRHYQQPSSIEEDDILLQKPIIKGPPPPDCRRHGRTNLLHRATKEGSESIVLQMVKCGHRSLDAKNEEGQTAVHLATITGQSSILSILIGAGTNVNSKDSASCTPLHYACINNLPEIVRILLEEGNANPQIRRNDNGWVPMHEAACRGHLECIRMLRKFYAPLRPRTLDFKLPIHLAIENNVEEAIRYFDTVKSRKALSNKNQWYHGNLERKEALNALRLCQKSIPNSDPNLSYYLIRKHSLKDGNYVLTLLFQGHTYNFQIERECDFYYIDDGPYLDTLEHVVDHYSKWQDGLPSPLHIPVAKAPFLALPPTPPRNNSGPNSLEIPPALPRRTPMSCSPNTLSRLCHEIHDVANNNLSRSLPPFCRDRIPPELLVLGKSLGCGENGDVYEGKLTMGNFGPVIDVAVKTIKADSATMSERTKKEFLKEAEIMMSLEHENIVRIIGICLEPEVGMVQELLELGSLAAFLQNHPDQVVPERDFQVWAHQIAKGMVYLQRKRLVHRDLASRNVLLSKERIAKISDFGLSRALGGTSDLYISKTGGRWPIKWYAPECFAFGNFSHAGDVWSYAVLLWEIYSYGATPYGDGPGSEVIAMVERGERLEKPKHCPDKVYSIMKKCWNKEVDLRPTFSFLENFFSQLESFTIAQSEKEQPNRSTASTSNLDELLYGNVGTSTSTSSLIDFDNNLNPAAEPTNTNSSSELINLRNLSTSLENVQLIQFD